MRHVSDFIGEVRAAQKSISDSLVRGNASNYETYQNLVGQHQGLEKALDILNNLLKEEEDDDR